MAAGDGKAQTASLVQYGSDSDSDAEAPSARPPKAAPTAASSIMPRSIKPVKRPAPTDASISSSSSSSSSLTALLPAPVAKKAKLDIDPFGLGNGTQKSAVSTKALPATTSTNKIDSRPAQPSASSATSSSSPRIAQLHGSTSASTTAAQVEAEPEADEIPFGWAQDPDGTLYPVTPQAHQQYAEWQAAQAAAQKAEAKASTDPAGKEDMPSYSAAQLAESGRRPNASSSSALDARYAAAAAEVAGEAANGAPAAKNKGTNSRARYKGQLSALLAIAKEREEELQDKHAQGKDRQRDARLRYGF
ncbi:hypothetical protein OC846_002699 [Tilletia horrida]|uniref:Mitotic checkpoint regulator, MAD2B-interacting-domain-containing protein n=1 Tax=Tilletia horrida TaxID=155126 RepID=A0AAN6JSE8_9BASI|nr:hypothetical protein OC846_002699 [Tilletia horrida]KAK0566264.1 hypothetical protein OC861_003343 [Tilletia horrida]